MSQVHLYGNAEKIITIIIKNRKRKKLEYNYHYTFKMTSCTVSRPNCVSHFLLAHFWLIHNCEKVNILLHIWVDNTGHSTGFWDNKALI